MRNLLLLLVVLFLSSCTLSQPSDTRFLSFEHISGRLEKFDQMQSKFNSEDHSSFNKYISGIHSLEQVNAKWNRIAYVTDIVNYRVDDYWATPIELLKHGGDCEDYAIAKYETLKQLGYSEDQLKIAIVYVPRMSQYHAILLVESVGKIFVLDNLSKHVKEINEIQDYNPSFALNANELWKYNQTTQ